MILDHIGNADRYANLHPLFAAAFRYLRKTDHAARPDGRVDIDGDRIFALHSHPLGRGHDGARLEIHRKYIDIQFVVSGHEEIGWKALASCRKVTDPYDAQKDVGFFGDTSDTWSAVPPGHFVIYWPEDAHAPLGGEGSSAKVVVKIAVA